MKSRDKNYFRKEITRQAAYHLVSRPNVIKLDQNELGYDFSPKMKAEFIKRVKALPIQRYPEVRPSRLRQVLARELKVRPEQILPTNGSNVLISAIIVAAAVKQKVMALEPTFALYQLAAEALGNRFIPLKLKAADFSFDLKGALKKIKKEKPQIIFIANPNAPTGNLLPTKAIEKVIQAAPGLVVIDEAYHQFSGVTFVPKIKKYANLMVLQTFSKALGLGGGRLGYLVSRKENISEVEKAVVPYCISRLSEEAALIALKNKAHFNKIVQEVKRERERVFAALKKLPKVTAYPTQANFILFRVANAQACFNHLLKKGVLVRDQSSYPGLRGCLRVSIGTPRENNAFLRAIQTY